MLINSEERSLEARTICVMAIAPEIRVYEGRFELLTYSTILPLKTVIRANKFSLSGPTIEFLVGPGAAPVTFHLHETLVCASSRFCNCAVNGTWKESKSRSILLDDVDASIFRICVSWLLPSTASSAD